MAQLIVPSAFALGDGGINSAISFSLEFGAINCAKLFLRSTPYNASLTIAMM